MARGSMLSDTDSSELSSTALPGGFMPGTVAPFVMRYGTDFLVAMQRAAMATPSQQHAAEGEPA